MSEDVFPGNSETARLMRELDWSQTSLGPIEQWPQSLRTSVSTCLDCAFPIILWWGPDLSLLYNDEYAQILGPKHPAALGQPGAKVWAEIWDVIEPMLAQVMDRAEPTRSRDLLLHVDRGYPEEAYFSFSYSPIHAEGGKIGGIFCPVIETTEKVIGERRLRTLRDLAARCKGAESEQSVYDAAASILAANPFDVPFALIYRVDEHHSEAELRAAAGISAGTPASPERISVVATGSTEVDLSQYTRLPTGAWKVPAKRAMVLPVLLPGQDRPRVILVAATSPMRALDEDYRTFFSLIATQIASALADTQALEQERHRAEALAELDRAKTAFFSNVSHEFRTPLTLMIGPLEDLRAGSGGPVSTEAAAALDVAHRNSLRLLKLVNTLLDFSRIEAGRVDASYEPTDLAALTSELASVFRSAIEKAGLRLLVDCEPVPEPVFVDHDMWEKIVLNLLSNALKFTFDGEIAVTLRWRGDHVELTVRDTGVGIAESDLPRMFQRFHRVRHARARTHEGTGIGLALVQELARMHGGTVSVTSREGAGSNFVIRIRTGSAHLPPDRIAAGQELVSTSVGAIPYVEEALRWLPSDDGRAPSTDMDAELPAATSAGTGHAARVIVADDNADMRQYLGRMLGQVYDVETVSDGRTALQSIQADPPDLVLTDVMMPELDGFGLLAAIRTDERLRSVPVILLSARAGEEARIEGLRAGADEYLVKPFSGRELLARVASQLQLAQLRRRNEAALRYQNEQHEMLVNQAPVGVYFIDADFRVREVNPIAAPVFADVPGGVIGRDFSEAMHTILEPEYAASIVRIFRHTLETGEPYHQPEVAERRIGPGVPPKYFDWRIARITLPDGRHGLVCYFLEITAQVRARLTIAQSEQELREADRRKDEFLALLAHELRNPLAPIRTGLELIRLSGDTPQSVARVRALMERQVHHMVRLIDDLLDVSRIASGKIVLQRAPTVLSELVQGAVESQRAAIDAAGLTLTVELAEPACVVDVDPARIVQVLSNVLHNAAKFTPSPGAVRITSRTRPGSTGPVVEVTVSDTGIGISSDMLPRVFELFTQAESATERTHGGLGIGLALAHRLLELHGGTITGHSDGRGTGSCFTITLPVSHAAPTVSPPRVEVPAMHGRVVIVDDNQDAARTMAMLVEKLGGSARTAHDAAGGISAVRDFRPDIVLLDIGMPGMDGYEACRRIRQQPSERPVILVAVTGWGQDQDKQRALDAGFDAHLTKPVDPVALAQLLAGSPVG